MWPLRAQKVRYCVHRFCHPRLSCPYLQRTTNSEFPVPPQIWTQDIPSEWQMVCCWPVDYRCCIKYTDVRTKKSQWSPWNQIMLRQYASKGTHFHKIWYMSSRKVHHKVSCWVTLISQCCQQMKTENCGADQIKLLYHLSDAAEYLLSKPDSESQYCQHVNMIITAFKF